MKVLKKVILAVFILYACSHYNHVYACSRYPHIPTSVLVEKTAKIPIHKNPKFHFNNDAWIYGIYFATPIAVAVWLIIVVPPISVWLYLGFTYGPATMDAIFFYCSFATILAIGVDGFFFDFSALIVVIDIIILFVTEVDPDKYIPMENDKAISAINTLEAEFEEMIKSMEKKNQSTILLDKRTINRILDLVYVIATHENFKRYRQTHEEYARYIIRDTNPVTLFTVKTRLLAVKYLQLSFLIEQVKEFTWSFFLKMNAREYGAIFSFYARTIQHFNITVAEFVEFKEQLNALISPVGYFDSTGAVVTQYYYQSKHVIRKLVATKVQDREYLKERMEKESKIIEA